MSQEIPKEISNHLREGSKSSATEGLSRNQRKKLKNKHHQQQQEREKENEVGKEIQQQQEPKESMNQTKIQEDEPVLANQNNVEEEQERVEGGFVEEKTHSQILEVEKNAREEEIDTCLTKELLSKLHKKNIVEQDEDNSLYDFPELDQSIVDFHESNEPQEPIPFPRNGVIMIDESIPLPIEVEIEKQSQEPPSNPSIPLPVIANPPAAAPSPPRSSSTLYYTLEEDYVATSPPEKAYLSVSPQKFSKESPPRIESSVAAVSASSALRSLLKRPLLMAIQGLTQYRDVLQFLNDEAQYEFGFGVSKESPSYSYSPFIQTWLVPLFVNRNPSLQVMNSSSCSLSFETNFNFQTCQENENLPESSSLLHTTMEEDEELVIHREISCSSLSSASSSSSSSSKDEVSLASSELLLLLTCYHLAIACFWSSLYLFSTLTRGIISTLFSTSLTIFWMLIVTGIQWFIWLLFLPITIPLSLCKKVVFYLFPEINKKRQEGVSSAVCGTL